MGERTPHVVHEGQQVVVHDAVELLDGTRGDVDVLGEGDYV